MRAKGRAIVFEGPSCTGKTSLIARLCDPARGLGVERVPRSLLDRELKSLLDGLDLLEPRDLMFLYASRLSSNSAALRECVSDGGIVLVDRLDVSFRALFTHFYELDRAEVDALAHLASTPLPSCSYVFLGTDHDTYLARRSTRARDTGVPVQSSEFSILLDGFRCEYERLDAPKLWLDTSILSLEECVAAVEQAFLSRCLIG